jgi:hypothetical protein
MPFCDDNPCIYEWSTDHFSECVERHAYSTYDKFLKLHEGKANLMAFYYLLGKSVAHALLLFLYIK